MAGIPVVIIATSTNTLIKKTGMVILVGIADRLAISAAAIDPIATPHNKILLLPSTIAASVIGVNTHP